MFLLRLTEHPGSSPCTGVAGETVRTLKLRNTVKHMLVFNPIKKGKRTIHAK